MIQPLMAELRSALEKASGDIAYLFFFCGTMTSSIEGACFSLNQLSFHIIFVNKAFFCAETPASCAKTL